MILVNFLNFLLIFEKISERFKCMNFGIFKDIGNLEVSPIEAPPSTIILTLSTYKILKPHVPDHLN